ncbi:MAG: phage major capsid protein [Fimbriiglobus sp.]
MAQTLKAPISKRSTGGKTGEPRLRSAKPAPGTNPTNPGAGRTVQAVTEERNAAIAEAEVLEVRQRSGQLTDEENTRLEGLLTRGEQLTAELNQLRQTERLASLRSNQTEPVRTIPSPTTIPAQVRSEITQADALQLWFRAVTDQADLSTQARQRAASHGINLGSLQTRLACDFNGTLNRAKRRSLNTIEAGKGQEFAIKTFSQKVAYYLTYFCPMLAVLDSETTADGNLRSYPRIDDTSLISSYTSDGGGTQTNPTIPDADLSTGVVDIAAYDAVSGIHKVTQQALRDPSIGFEDKIAQAIANSHRRLIERDVILGNGTNKAWGITRRAARQGAVIPIANWNAGTALSKARLQKVYFSVSQAYREGAVWLVSSKVMENLVDAMNDTTGRTLLNTGVEDGIEVPTLFGRPVYVSEMFGDFAVGQKPVTFFNPSFYLLRMVEGMSITMLREKFWPLLGWCGTMAFGGDWRGPANAAQALEIGA